jgi:putative transposase
MQRFGLSERPACRLLGVFSRTAVRYQPRSRGDEALRSRLCQLAERYSRYGCLLLHGMLKNEGLLQNKKRTYRIYTELGLQVRTKRRKKLIRPRIPLDLPSRAGERWSLDFVHDQLSCGRRFRILNIVDDFSREYVLKIVDFSISGQRLARELNEFGRELPRTIVCDNGPGFTSKALYFLAKQAGV